MNFDTESAIDAERQWELDRREEQSPKLVVTSAWKGPCLPSCIVNDERQAVCPRCSAGWWSEGLLAFFPGMIEERAEEKCDLYLHQCREA